MAETRTRKGPARDRKGKAGASVTYMRVVDEVTRSGITQAELAKVVGAGPRTVQNWASGHNTPRGKTAERLLDIRTVVELLSDSYTDEGIDIWLHSRNRNLDMRRPIDMLTEGQVDRVLEEAKWVAGGMQLMDSLAARLAQASPTAVDGVWQRHVPAKYTDTALAGRRSMGRCSTEDGNPVLQLGRPTESVVVEAYRHLVDPIAEPDGRVPPIRPRVHVTCDVSVSEILDLRLAVHRARADLSVVQLQSQTRDRAAYAACQTVAAASHQVGYHGIVAPIRAASSSTGSVSISATRDQRIMSPQPASDEG